MSDKMNPDNKPSAPVTDYDSMLSSVVDLLEQARRTSARAVNAIMTATYWEIGRQVVEYEQFGKKRAGYGEEVLRSLSLDLTSKFGRGFSRQNIQRFRVFYLLYPPELICQTESSISEKKYEHSICSTLSGKSGDSNR